MKKYFLLIGMPFAVASGLMLIPVALILCLPDFVYSLKDSFAENK